MEKEEEKFHKQLLRKGEFDRPEAAVEYARWLLEQGRYEHAELVIYTALDEGPRFDLYEMRAMSALLNLEELWREVHRMTGAEKYRSSTDIYNEGLGKKDPDWKAVLDKIKTNLNRCR